MKTAPFSGRFSSGFVFRAHSCESSITPHRSADVPAIALSDGAYTGRRHSHAHHSVRRGGDPHFDLFHTPRGMGHALGPESQPGHHGRHAPDRDPRKDKVQASDRLSMADASPRMHGELELFGSHLAGRELSTDLRFCEAGRDVAPDRARGRLAPEALPPSL